MFLTSVVLTASLGPTVEIAPGVTMPTLSLGTWYVIPFFTLHLLEASSFPLPVTVVVQNLPLVLSRGWPLGVSGLTLHLIIMTR